MTHTAMRHRVRLAVLAAALLMLLPLSLVQTSAQATSSTTSAKQIAHTMMQSSYYNWTTTKQWNCLSALWTRESGWRVGAGAVATSYGIPQAYPGRKMATYGPDWRSSAKTQIKWGLHYIKGRYSSPCSADAHQRRNGWY